jgi:hypothetical protein
MIACGGGRSVEIELDAFSGRPNPKWTLSESKGSRLLEKIASLPEANDAPHPPGLGFRGFVVRSGDRSIRVFGGRVVSEGPGPVKVYRDTAGVLKELAEDARERGFEDVVGGSSRR